MGTSLVSPIGGNEPPPSDAVAGSEFVEVGDTPTTISLPTMGGMQFWADEIVASDWRVQRNVVTRNYRLLDARDVRRAWGTFQECRDALEAARTSGDVPLMKDRVVLVLHGLGRTRKSMQPMVDSLRHSGTFSVVSVGPDRDVTAVGTSPL